MVAVSLMFTIVSLHKQAKLEKARKPGPPVCRQLKIGVLGRGGLRVKRDLEIREQAREGYRQSLIASESDTQRE